MLRTWPTAFTTILYLFHTSFWTSTCNVFILNTWLDYYVKITHCRSLACMEGRYLVLHTEHLEELVLLLQRLFHQFNLCPCLGLEAVVFLLLLLLMMDFLLIDLQQRLHHLTFSYTGLLFVHFYTCVCVLLIHFRCEFFHVFLCVFIAQVTYDSL